MKIVYEFDSNYVEERYSCYDGTEFVFEIDDEDVKYDIIFEICENEEIEINKIDVITIIDNLCCWKNILNNEHTISFIKNKYMREAMNWYADENYIMTEEDYEAQQADAYNDKRWCEE